jgi:lipoprotein-anchoring transpeptidase ErfK/SrfK
VIHPCDTILKIDLAERRLRLFKLDGSRFHFVKQYPIAIGFYDGPGGSPDYRTPPGDYRVNKKAKNPDWLMPNSAWVPEELRGTTVKGGDPANPIVARWIELWNGVGIHGTAADDSIGTPASHGCIRMHADEVIDLYNRVPKGTIVEVR